MFTHMYRPKGKVRIESKVFDSQEKKAATNFPTTSDHVGEMSAESVSSTGPTGAPRHLAVVHAGFELHESVELEAKRDFITEKNWGAM